jgi:DNA-binding response OmpR family regulator
VLRYVPTRYQFANVVLDTQKAEVASNGEQVKLTAREFHLLRYSAEHSGIALISQELFRQVWGHRADTFTRIVDMHFVILAPKTVKLD